MYKMLNSQQDSDIKLTSLLINEHSERKLVRSYVLSLSEKLCSVPVLFICVTPNPGVVNR